MKKSFGAILFLSAFFLIGCTTDLETEINNLAKRVSDLEAYCAELNTNINTLQTLANKLASQNYISSVADYKENGYVVGYKILFSDGTSVIIYNGKDGADGVDGKTPTIGVAAGDDGNLYWTVSYGDGTSKFLTDASGNKILAVGIDGKDGADGDKGDKGDKGDSGDSGSDGVTPQLKIEGGYWYVSVDGGKAWTKLGQATGDAGDAIFKSVDTSDADYVTFTLTDGSTFSMPTQAAYDRIFQTVEDMNKQVKAMGKLVDSIYTHSIFVSSITVNVTDGDTLGYTVLFSDNTSVVLEKGVNGKDATAPEVTAAKAEDGIYYWQTVVDGKREWLLDPEGNKIKAAATDGKDAVNPVIGVADSAGVYYWTVKYGDAAAKWIRDAAGDKIKASATDGASFFTSVDYTSGEYAVFTLPDGKTVTIPLYAAYEKLLKKIDTLNMNIDALAKMADSVKRRKYISSISVDANGTDTLGYYLTFSDGTKLSLFNGSDAVVPIMGVAKDTDGEYYWTVRYGASKTEWVYDDAGKKVKAVASDGADGKSPVISVKKDKDNYFYWVLVNGADTTFITDSEGEKVMASAKDGADGTSFFSSIKSDENFMTVVLADGKTTFQLPIYKQFALSKWVCGTTALGSDYSFTSSEGTGTYNLTFTVSCSYIDNPDIQYYSTSGIKSVSVGTITHDTALSTFSGIITVTLSATPVTSDQKLILFFGDNAGKTIMRSVYFK